MADRSVKVTLTLSAEQYKAELQKAAKATEDLGKSGEKAGTQSKGALDKMLSSARENREAWTTTGTALLAVGGAITGIGLAAAKTGIEYNTLQQTSRAALTTLLGSAEAANAQMDKLDAFARTSPFAKQTFIKAQQQMLAFGIETKKVIPYLDAVQNAVAAAGGSNADIAAIVETMSKIQSSAKITAQDLIEFGNRGVNAADLIGSQMGKTGAQIRADITAGSLDATAALDALAAGMQATYGGAADNVKTTMSGAFDRVKAAWRDLSSDLMEPLVSKNGGGFLVDITNGVADAMRAFQNLPGPVKAVVGALGGLVGAGSLAAGTFLTLAPRLVATWDALAQMGKFGAGAQGAIRGLGSAMRAAASPIGLAVAGIVAAVAAIDKLTTAKTTSFSLEQYTSALLDVRDSAGLSTAALDEFFQIGKGGGESLWNYSKEITSLDDALTLLHNNDWWSDGWRDTLSWLPGASNADFQQAREGIEGIDQALSALVSGGNAEDAAAVWDMLVERAAALGIGIDDLKSDFPEYADALKAVENEQRLTAGAMDETSLAAAEQAAAAQEAADAWAKSAQSAGDSFGSIIDAYQSADAAAKESSDGAVASMDDWIAKMREQREATERWAENYRTALLQVAQEVPETGQAAAEAFVQEMVAAGADGAQALQMFVDGTPEQRAALIAEWSGTAAAIEDVMGVPTIEVAVNTTPGAQAVDAFHDYVTGLTSTTLVDADTNPADMRFNAITGKMEAYTSTTKVDANTAPATGKFNALTGTVESTTSTTHIDAEDSGARAIADASFRYASAMRPSMSILANDSSARGTINNTVAFGNSKSSRLSVFANTGQAERDINYAARARTVSLTVRATGGGSLVPSAAMATGGIIEMFAAGGFHNLAPMAPIAQVVPPNTWRVVGDNPRVDEAYIPLERSARSMAILGEAARRMGHAILPLAKGAVTSGRPIGAAGASGPVRVDVSTPPIDYDRLARVLAPVVVEAARDVALAVSAGTARSAANTRTTRGVAW